MQRQSNLVAIALFVSGISLLGCDNDNASTTKNGATGGTANTQTSVAGSTSTSGGVTNNIAGTTNSAGGVTNVTGGTTNGIGGVTNGSGGTTNAQNQQPSKSERFSGVAQKGPYSRGASVVVSELDEGLNQTGRTFTTEIQDNSGRFDVGVSSFTGPYAKLSANGYYFNEVLGQVSSAPLGLVALVDATQDAAQDATAPDAAEHPTVNINILTHLETPRVEYLVDHGLTFASAKKQAQKEVLAALMIDLPSASASESLDIAGGSEADAALLAASILLQGYLSVGELSELLSTIAGDLREDGKLDDTKSGSLLKNAATLVDPALIRKHIQQRYADLGITATIGNFESYVTHFRDAAPYPFVSRSVFPEVGTFGPNLLFPGNDGRAFPGSTFYSVAAKTPNGQPLQVRPTWTEQNVSPPEGGWGIRSDSVNCLAQEDSVTHWSDLTVIQPGQPSDCGMYLPGNGSIRIDVYEGDAQALTATRTISWGDSASDAGAN